MKGQINSHWVFSLIIAVLIPGFGSLKAQNKEAEKPKIEIKVNKEKDENGNVIRFDSTYSFSWQGENLSREQMDSIFQNFGMDHHFGDFFRNDFFNRDYFKDDFFGNDSLFSRFMDPFMNRDFFDNHPSDSLKPGIYDGFFPKSFMDHSSFDRMREMMENHQKEMMEYFNQFKSQRDSSTIEKPEIRKQNGKSTVRPAKIIKT